MDDKIGLPPPTVDRHQNIEQGPVMVAHQELLAETGRALRRARQARGMTLRDVGAASNGRFKPTAVAAYERAERAISLERFCELAHLYDMAPERLLAQIMWRIGGGPEPTIDRTRVPELPEEEAEAVGTFIQEVRRLRGDTDEAKITVRIQDLEVLATLSGHQLGEFLEHLLPALANVSSAQSQEQRPRV